MSDDENDNHIHGTIEEVLAKLAEQVRQGLMTPEQLANLAALMGAGKEVMHDVSIGFRVGLISQGYEEIALMLSTVHMVLAEPGAMFTYGVNGRANQDFIDNLTPEQNRAFLVASVMVLRAGNIDAEIAEDNLHIEIAGPIVTGDEVDHDSIVNRFVDELDQIFPDIPHPKPRQGEWW